MNDSESLRAVFGMKDTLRSVFEPEGVLWYAGSLDSWILAGVKVLAVVGEESVGGVIGLHIVLDHAPYEDAVLAGGEVEILLKEDGDDQYHLWVRRIAPPEGYALEVWRLDRRVEALKSARAEMRWVVRRSYRRCIDGIDEWMDLLLMANSLGDMEVVRSSAEGDRVYVQTRDERVAMEVLYCRSGTAELAKWDFQFEESQA